MDLKELSNDLNKIDKQCSYYTGNLRGQKQIKALDQHFMIFDCDEILKRIFHPKKLSPKRGT